MFELAKRTDINTLRSLFIVNLETKNLINCKYFWEQKIEYDQMIKFGDLNFNEYLRLRDSYWEADGMLRYQAHNKLHIYIRTYKSEILVKLFENAELSLEFENNLYNGCGNLLCSFDKITVRNFLSCCIWDRCLITRILGDKYSSDHDRCAKCGVKKKCNICIKYIRCDKLLCNKCDF